MNKLFINCMKHF